VRCNHCGQNNFNWVSECERCHAPLQPALTSPEPPNEPATRPGPAPVEPAAGTTSSPRQVIVLNSPDEPFRVGPDGDELDRRDLFIHTLFTNTPHPFVTWSVIALNVAVFVLMVLRGASIGQVDLDTSLRWGASYAPFITQGEWWRLLTATFVHGGILHLAANMYVLFAMGPVTERLYGNAAYAVLYLFAGLAGSLASVYWHPMVTSVGASGAVFGVMGGVLAFAARQRRSLPPAALRSIASSVGQAVAINLVLGFATPHVDMAAHIGGLLGGLVFGAALALPLDELSSRKQRRAAAVAAAGIVLVIIAARQLPRYDDWLGAIAMLNRVENESVARFNALLKDTRTDQKVRDEAAKAFTEQTLAKWTATRQQIARLRLPKAEHEIASRFVRSMDLQGEGWRLYADAYRTGDLQLVKESRDKLLEATAIKTGRPQAIPKNDPLDALIAKQQALVARQQVLQHMAAADQQAATAYNDAVKLLRAGKITPGQLGQIIETKVIPPAREGYEAVSKLTADAEQQAKQQALTDYMRLRLESWTLRAQGARADSVDLFRAADKKQAEAQAAMRRATAPE